MYMDEKLKSARDGKDKSQKTKRGTRGKKKNK